MIRLAGFDPNDFEPERSWIRGEAVYFTLSVEFEPSAPGEPIGNEEFAFYVSPPSSEVASTTTETQVPCMTVDSAAYNEDLIEGLLAERVESCDTGEFETTWARLTGAFFWVDDPDLPGSSSNLWSGLKALLGRVGLPLR